MPAPNYAMTLPYTTEAALTRPDINARHLTIERDRAREEVSLLEQCLAELEPGSREHREISEDIDWIKSLTGWQEKGEP